MNSFQRFLSVLFLLFIGANNAADAQKYIFYWGTAQATLEAEKQYVDTLKITDKELALLAMSPRHPRIWDGKAMLDSFTLTLEGVPLKITSLPAQSDANALKVAMQKVAARKPGEHLLFDHIALGSGRVGRIYIEIAAEQTHYVNSNSQRIRPGNTNLLRLREPSVTNPNLLTQVSWGIHFYRDLQRHYFTTAELLESIGEAPFLSWATEESAVPYECMITVANPSASPLAIKIDPNNYRAGIENFLSNASNYLKTGAAVVLTLQDTRSYSPLFTASIVLVAPDDPRLKLQYARDRHRVTVEWGDYTSGEATFYLKEVTLPDGTKAHADLNHTFFLFPKKDAEKSDGATSDNTVDRVKRLLEGEVSFFVDGRKLDDVQKTISLEGVSYPYTPGGPIPAGLTEALEKAIAGWRMHILLLELRHAHYDLVPLGVRIAILR